MSFLSGVVKFFKSDSIGSSLAKTAILGFVLNKLSKSALKDNQSGTENIDAGVRLQIAPNAESKIPVLYGSAFFGGNINDAAMTNANKTMWYSLALSETTGTKYSSGGPTEYTFENVYWNDQRIIFESDGVTVSYTVDRSGTIDRSLSGLVKVYLYAGDTSSASQQAVDGYSITAANAYDLFPNWTSSTHVMEDLVFALVRVDYNREKNVTGIGNMLFHVTSNMYAPGDVFYDYMTNTRYGAGIDSAEIDTTDVTALNTYSFQSVAYDDEGTGAQTLEDRYQINGLIDTANPVLQNAEAVLSAAASWLSYDSHEGKWGIVINKAETSIASFDDSNILGSIDVTGTGLQDLYNSVNVEFPHRELRDSGDFVKIEIPSGDRNANEEDNTLEITYDIINEPIQAQLLGFIELKQSRVDKIIQFQTDYGYYNLKAGDVIDVTSNTYGFTSKLFRITSITEVQDNDGALLMDITALEYDSNVYSTADLFRYTRSDSNGIITIGSIGTPGTPNVTKYEIATRPRIEIDSTSPTGVVEGLEFWLTTDVAEPDDDLRSYTLIGTVRPIGGGVFTSGTTVTLEYSALEASDFYIKTRGFNTTTVGPYSNVSGLVEFEPTQVTNAIDANTIATDGLGGLLTTLAVVDLLQGVDDLYALAGGEGSLFEAIFDTFEDVTGVDLVSAFGGATETYALSSNIAQVVEGNAFIITLSTSNVANGTTIPYTITGVTSADINGASLTGSFTINSNTASIAFSTTSDSINEGSETFTLTLDSITPTTSVDVLIVDAAAIPTYALSRSASSVVEGDNFTITLTTTNLSDGTTIPYTITGVNSSDIDGASLAGNFTISSNSASLIITTTDDAQTEGNETFTLTLDEQEQSISVTITEPTVNYLTIGISYPPNRQTYLEPTGEEELIPITGSYFMYFENSVFYGELTAGSGNIKLYKSDGTLVETLTASSLIFDNDLVEFPFATRTYGTDYYILMDEGVINYCDAVNPSISSPLIWNFNTSVIPVDPYSVEGNALTPAPTLTATEISYGCDDDLFITFDRNVTVGTGTITIKLLSDDSVTGSIDASTGVASGNVITYSGAASGNTVNFDTHYIEAPAGIAVSNETDCNLTGSNSEIIEAVDNLTFYTNPFELLTFHVVENIGTDLTKVNRQSNIVLQFSRTVRFGTGSIFIYSSSGVYQEIDVETTFNNDYTSELLWLGGVLEEGDDYNTNYYVHINPTVDFTPGENYYVLVDNGAIIDAVCNTLYGLTDTSEVAFIVDTGPTASTTAMSDNYVITTSVDRDVVPGTGKLKIYDGDGILIQEVNNDNSAITIT